MAWSAEQREKYSVSWDDLPKERRERYYAQRREVAAAKAIAECREPGRIGRPPRLTPEEKEASRIKQNKRRSLRANASIKKQRAERALAEGRTPGLVGVRSKRTPEERKQAAVARVLKYKAKNLASVRAKNAALAKAKRDAIRAGTYVKAERMPVSLDEKRRQGVANSHNRRARKANAGGTHTSADIAWLYEKQKGKCVFCLLSFGGEKPHVDHYIPLKLGGSNDRSNLRLLHETCNLMKSAKHPVEFALNHGMLAW